MLSDKLPAHANLTEFPSVFRTDAWISSWKQAWENYLKKNKFPTDENYYYISLPLLRFKLATAVPFGCSSSSLRSIRSEYFELQADQMQYFSPSGHKWRQIIIPDVERASSTYTRIESLAKEKDWFCLQRSVATAYGVVTNEGSFADYLSQLSQSARARLFNKRKKLEQLGEVRIENIWPNLDKFIELLNAFHLERWGKPCYQNENLEFIKRFLNAVVAQGAKVNLSVLSLDDQPISLLLDVEYAGRVYNFQAGFVEKLTKNIALGSLHLGYAIESAFSDPSIHYYDFMAGQGKNTDYKAAFANHTQSLATLYIIKSAWLYWLYRLNDRIKS